MASIKIFIKRTFWCASGQDRAPPSPPFLFPPINYTTPSGAGLKAASKKPAPPLIGWAKVSFDMLFYSEQNFFFKVASVFDVFWKPAVLGRTSFIALFDRRAIYEGLNNKKTGSLPPRMFRNEPNLKQVTFLKICIWRFVMECEFTQGGYRYKHGHTWKLASSWVIPLCGGQVELASRPDKILSF